MAPMAPMATLETIPELRPTETTKLVPDSPSKHSHGMKGKLPKLDSAEKTRVSRYETSQLGTWGMFGYTAGTVWRTVEVWQCFGHLLLTSLVFVLLSFAFGEYMGPINPAHFNIMATSLNVVVAFLLGFYLSTSVSRWMDTVNGFLLLVNAARNLDNQLLALGAPLAQIEQVNRYGILSARFLSKRIQRGEGIHPHSNQEVAHTKRVVGEQRRANKDVHDLETGNVQMDKVTSSRKCVDQFLKDGLLTVGEASTLKKVKDHSSLMWIWVALIIGRLAEDGHVPGMATPTYGRLMVLAQDAQTGIRKVCVSMQVSTPFVYVHFLAMLVHLNNILCAVSFGCILGTSLSTMCYTHGIRAFGKQLGTQPDRHGMKDDNTENMVSLIVVSFATNMLAPLLYQAALQIGLLLSQPFHSEVAKIPTERLISELRRDLQHAKIMAEHPPGFEKPCFKQPAK